MTPPSAAPTQSDPPDSTVPIPPATSEHVESHITQSDRIPIGQKLAFSFGASTDYIAAGMTVGVLWMPYFNIGLGMSPALLGGILMLLQAWNAIIDPIMGNLSDNARTPWGRRRPFMAVGSIATALLFLMLWRVPVDYSDWGKALYLTIVGVFFFTAYSSWAMPYYGMQLELTPNYDERTRLNAWTTFFGKITSLLSGWIMAIITGPWFIDPLTGKADLVKGLLTCSGVIAVFILFCGMIPALFVKERHYKAASHQTRDPLWKSIKESATCRPLWMVIGVTFFLVIGSSSVGALGQYLNIYYVMHGDISAASIITGWKVSVLVLTGIACLPLWTWLGERFDKKVIVGAMLSLSMLGHLSNLFLLTPDAPYLQLIPAIFESGAISAVWLFIPSMKADIADYDELYTKRRREGALNAFFSWFFKAAMTCSMGLGGLLLTLTQFNAKIAEQPPEVLGRMFWLYLLLPLIIWSAAILFIVLYPLDRARMLEIRRELEVRRGQF